MNERLSKVTAAAFALVALMVGTALGQPNLYYNPIVVASGGNAGWTNGIACQTSATAFNGQTNRTRIDLTSAPYGLLTLGFRGTVTASTAATNVIVRISGSMDPLTNGFVGPATNTAVILTWYIPTLASASSQTVTAVTNVSSTGLVGALPYVYVESVVLGYADSGAYLTNWSIRASAK